MPIATLWAEAGFIQDRINSVLITQALLTKSAIVDSIAGGNVLKEAIEELNDG